MLVGIKSSYTFLVCNLFRLYAPSCMCTNTNLKYIIIIFSWDEWVPENRVLKFNDANVQRQKEVTIQHNTNLKKAKGTNFLIIRISELR